MSAWRACVRLWIFGSVVWVAFWAWNDLAHCTQSNNGLLWCPTANGESLLKTDYLHAVLLVLGPPLVALVVGLLCAWAVRATQNSLDHP